MTRDSLRHAINMSLHSRNPFRVKSLSKMLRQVQIKMFTFEFDSEAAIVGSTRERGIVPKSAFQLPTPSRMT